MRRSKILRRAGGLREFLLLDSTHYYKTKKNIIEIIIIIIIINTSIDNIGADDRHSLLALK